MAGFLQSLLDDYRQQMERHRNRRFLNAAMAACALAACAEGEVTFSQRIRVDQILDTLERLKVFDPHEGVDLFNAYTGDILTAPRDGQRRAQEAVQEFTGDPETAGLLVRICLAVAESSGDKSLSQQIQIVMLCSLLGVEPRHAGLYTDGSPEHRVIDA
jgi:tellurite resistance protein